MKKRILNRKRLSQVAYSIGMLLLCINASWGQQVIGEFSYMNGGFEGQSAGALGTVTNTGLWSKQNTATVTSTLVVNASGARSGANYVTGSTLNSTTITRVIVSPASTTISPAASVAHTIQFYVKNCTATGSTNGTGVTGGITTTTSGYVLSNPSPIATSASWTKVTMSFTPAVSAPNPSLACLRLPILNPGIHSMDVDDFVVYAGGVDTTAPSIATVARASSVTTTGQTISWTAPSTGVDGGGYMVVRGTTDPSTPPMVNGIYAVGNSIGSGTVVSIGTGTSFTATGLTAGTTYYYRIYTVDKAFNYSSALTFNSTTVSSTSTTWNGATWTNGTPTPALNAIIDAELTATESLIANSLTVNSGKTLTIATGHNVTVQNAVTNNGTLNIENNGNLIQVNNVTNSGTGTTTVKRNSNPLFRLDYTMWSSPVTAQNLFAFSPLTSAVTPIRFYLYNPLSDKYVTVDPAGSFLQGRGYLIRMPNEKPGSLGTATAYYAGTETLAYPGVFTGTLNNGTINVSLVDSNKYVSVGNPYPSAISADLFLSGNSTAGTLYFWRKTNGVSGTAYATYTAAGGVGTGPGNGGLGNPNGTIQVGQGFIVKATSTSLSFTNAMRETAPSSTQFFKTKKVADKSRVWLSLSDAKGGLNQAMIAYIDGTTLGVDSGYDGKYFNDSAIALTSTIDSEEYVIQARPTFDATDVVALGFKTDVAGDYSIALDSFDGVFAEGQDVYLVDAVAGKEIDLKAGSYSFTATAGADNARFSLKYQKTLKVDAPAFNDNTVKVYRNNGAIVVNSTAKAIKTIAVYDVQGRLLAQQKNVNATTATISNLKAVRQVLIVKISADDNSVVSKKVLN